MAKTCKYYKEKQLVSYDSGNTWQPTGLTRRGNLYESDSADCGYMTQYKWEVVSGYVCDVTTYTKYEKTQKFQSTNGGQTWEAVLPALYRRGNVLEYNSTDCGYEPPIDYSDVYLTFIPISAATKFSVTKILPQNSVSYSLDEGATWTPLANGESTPSVQPRQKIMWKGTLTRTEAYRGICRFDSTDKFDVESNSMSLIYGDNFRNQTTLIYNEDWMFTHLFSGCTNIVSAENMILPATALTYNCYFCMFDGCTSLTKAPQLPATALAQGCYADMFADCTSLTVAPQLPATALAIQCYENMFNGCTSLTTAPVLSATTLEAACYSGMFANCTNLTVAPQLPATTLANNCYINMFQNCTSLTTMPQLPATTMIHYCYSSMFAGCTSLTTIPSNYLSATTLADGCYRSMFSGCTNLTVAPQLPATTLASYCYAYMFESCTSLTKSPILSAATLVVRCYEGMFQGCTNLNEIKCLATDKSAEACTTIWVNGVSSSGTFYKASSMNDWTTGISGIPSGWTVQNY